MKYVVLTVMALVFLATPRTLDAQPSCEGEIKKDGVYLLTMHPGGQMFNAFGHNGLYVLDFETRTDTVYNYGVFDPSTPNMTEAFVKGELVYWLGTRSFESMLALYGREERTVVLTELSLPREARREIVRRLEENALPENAAYDYHWFEDNCSTRIRDMVDEVTDGAIAKASKGEAGFTIRQELLRSAGKQPGFWFLLDFSISDIGANELNKWDAMFLPERLNERVHEVSLVWPDGKERPLAVNECTLIEGKNGTGLKAPPSRWLWLWGGGLGFALILFGLGALARFWPARALLGFLIAAYGLLLAALATISIGIWLVDGLQLFSGTWNLFFISPGHWLVAVAGVMIALPWRRAWRWATRLLWANAAVAVLGILIAFIQGFSHGNFGIIGAFTPALFVAAWLGHRLAHAAPSSDNAR